LTTVRVNVEGGHHCRKTDGREEKRKSERDIIEAINLTSKNCLLVNCHDFGGKPGCAKPMVRRKVLQSTQRKVPDTIENVKRNWGVSAARSRGKKK